MSSVRNSLFVCSSVVNHIEWKEDKGPERPGPLSVVKGLMRPVKNQRYIERILLALEHLRPN
jgi:hypothetical protein